MKKQKIIAILTKTYPINIRRELIETILLSEKENKIPNYTLINQIFSYVLSEWGWDMNKRSQTWDHTPLDIMHEVFPNLQNTQWYKEQVITAQQQIDIVIHSK